MAHYRPPFKITPSILRKSQEISRELGALKGYKMTQAPLKLRRTHNIRTIQASLSIEGNTLSIDQMTDLLEDKRVIGPFKDILEAKNAIHVYSDLKKFNPLMTKNLLKAHGILMTNLIEGQGKWRTGEVGIFKGKEISHVAPPAKRVPTLMEELFDFIKNDQDFPWLLKACIFHYEFEFIHPFTDGNGRMGRLWQQLLLMKEDSVFEFIPVEVLIKNHQDDYYKALETSDALGESTPFVEFSINIIHQSLIDYSTTISSVIQDQSSRLFYTKSNLQKTWFSRKDYLLLHKNISSATASRDLLEGVKEGTLIKKGEKNQMLYSFK